jgi:16S rRNA (uracil1498-N3)-methyltransferase
MPVFFISAEQVRDGAVTITGPLCQHLRSSLRLKMGEQIWLGDEHRRRYLITAIRIDRTAVLGKIVEERAGPAAAGSVITIGQALLKGDRMDWLIQKTTELGVASVVPLVTHQTIVRPKATRLPAQEEHWQRIALEAAQQSERWDHPIVTAPRKTGAFFKDQPPDALKLILSERSSGRSLATVNLPSRQTDGHVVLAVGPEGGWTKEETALALHCGFTPITLGSRILRAETAAVAALSVLQSRLGELE